MGGAPGHRSPAAESGFAAHVGDLLRAWAPVALRRMFGGHGVFRGPVMIGILDGGTLFLRTDEGNRADFEAAGMAPFRYMRAGRMVALGYHAVPAELLDDPDRLAAWAEGAYAAALRRAAAAGGRKGRRDGGRRPALE